MLKIFQPNNILVATSNINQCNSDTVVPNEMQNYENIPEPVVVSENLYSSNFSNQEPQQPPPTTTEPLLLSNDETPNYVQPEILCNNKSQISVQNGGGSVICNQCGSDLLTSNVSPNYCESIQQCPSTFNSMPNISQEPITHQEEPQICTNSSKCNQLNPTETISYVNPIIQSSYAQLKHQIQNQQNYYKQFVNEFNQGFYQTKSNGLDSTLNRPISARSKVNDKILYNETKKLLPMENDEPTELVTPRGFTREYIYNQCTNKWVIFSMMRIIDFC